jgi:hypothetical protein
MGQAIYRDRYGADGADFFRQQSALCFALARMALSREHRETFIRLAWHWRTAARAADVMHESVQD